MTFSPLLVALTEMRRHPIRTLLTISGVAIAIATVVGVGSMLGSVHGFISTLLDEAGGLNQVTVIYREQRLVGGKWTVASRPNPLTVRDSSAIRGLLRDQVSAVSLRTNINVVLSNAANSQQLTAQAVEPDYFMVFRRRLASGRFFDHHEMSQAAVVIVIGENTARTFFGRGDAVGRELRVNNIRFRVIGVVADTSLGQAKGLEVLLPASTARFRFGSSGRGRFLNVRIHEGVDLTSFKTSLLSTVVAQHPDYDARDFEIFTAEENVAQARQGMMLVGLVFFLICGLCLLTGGVGVMNILLSSVAERTREIGLRTAVGARRRDVLMQFLLEALSFSLLGGFVGTAVGYGFGFILSFIVNLFMNASGQTLFRLTPSLHPLILLAAIVTSCAVGIIFGIYPALKASRLDPVEALRAE